MTIDRSTATAAAVAASAADLSPSERHGIFLYLGILIVLLAFGGPAGGLIDIPISFFLKNRLHLTAHEVATFRLIAAIPLYLSFVFGFMRDIWNPLGMRDRGFMLLFGGVTALLYVLFAFTPMSYATLLFAVVVLTASFLFVSSAQNGLTSVIGQQHAMTGQVSAVWNVFLSIPTVGALLIGGKLSGLLEEKDPDQALRILFLVGAAIMTAIALYALWKPAEVFDNIRIENGTGYRPIEDLKRLVGHWPVYPAMLIWLLWNFAPGSTTPLQYHLQNALHATDAQWGEWNAIFAASFIPTYIVYGLLCRKFPLKTLLLWGTFLAIPQMVPLLFIDTVHAGFDRGDTHRPDGRSCHRRLSGPDHSVVPAGPAGNDADDVLEPLLRRFAIWRCSRHPSLRSLRRLYRLRHRDHDRLRADPACIAAGAETPDRHGRWANAGLGVWRSRTRERCGQIAMRSACRSFGCHRTRLFVR